jgi:hypothetical protein
MTWLAEARYRAPRADRRLELSSLWEVADIVERIFRIAATCNLHPRPEDYDATTCDYQAAHGLLVTRMRGDAPV